MGTWKAEGDTELFLKETQSYCSPQPLFFKAPQLCLLFPSAPVPGRAQHGFQELLDLVGVCVYFGAIQQERELSTWAKLLNGLCPPGEGAGCQERKRGVRSRNGDIEMEES